MIRTDLTQPRWTILERNKRRRRSRALVYKCIFFFFFSFFFLFFESVFLLCIHYLSFVVVDVFFSSSKKEKPTSQWQHAFTGRAHGFKKRYPSTFSLLQLFSLVRSSFLFIYLCIFFFLCLSLNSNHLNNESGKTSRGKRCPWARRRETTTLFFCFFRREEKKMEKIHVRRPSSSSSLSRPRLLVAPAQDWATRSVFFFGRKWFQLLKDCFVYFHFTFFFLSRFLVPFFFFFFFFFWSKRNIQDVK